jgi:hypothetical protein
VSYIKASRRSIQNHIFWSPCICCGEAHIGGISDVWNAQGSTDAVKQLDLKLPLSFVSKELRWSLPRSYCWIWTQDALADDLMLLLRPSCYVKIVDFAQFR